MKKIQLRLLVIGLVFLAVILSILVSYKNNQQIITGFAVSGTCSGTAHACSSHNGDQTACTAAGCNYNTNNNKCTASHNACSTYSSQSDCELHACTWTADSGGNDTTTTTTTTTTATEGGGTSVQEVVGLAPRYPLGGDLIEHGTLQLKVQVYYAGEPSNGASVIANSTMFGEIKLVHEPDLPEGIYVANVTIGKDVEEGPQRIFYTVRQGSQYNEASLLVEVEPGLNIAINLAQKYNKGDSIEFSGIVLNPDGEPETNAVVIISGYKEDNKIFSLGAKTDENGTFSAPYLIRYADPEGVWNIKIEATSEDENVGIKTLSSTITVPPGVVYYSVNFLSPLAESLYRRGEVISISVEVKEIDAVLEGASVVVYTPSDEAITLEEVSPGVYAGNYVVKPDDSVDDWFLKAEATKQIGKLIKVGGANLPIKIGSTEIKFNILSPESEITYTNSRLKIKTKLTYPDDSLSKGAVLNAFLSNGEIIPLLEKSDGVYEGEYFVTTEDIGTLNVEINVKDANGNFGTFKQSLFVRKRSVIGNILAYVQDVAKKYWWAILAFLIAAALIYKPGFEISFVKRKIQRSIEEQKNLKAMQVDTEKKYYKEGKITKKEFRDIMEKYEERLAKAIENERIYKKGLTEKLERIKK